MSIKNKAIKGVKWTTIRSIVVILASTIKISILGRLLGPEEFGLMAMIMVVTGIANVFVITGFSDALIAKTEINEKQQATLYWLNFILGLIFVFILIYAAPFIADFFKQKKLTDMLRAISSVILVTSLTLQFEAFMKKELLFKQLSIIQIAGILTGALTAITFAYYGYGAWSLVWGAIANRFIISGGLFAYAVRNKWLPKFYFKLSIIKDFLSFGCFRIGAALISQINSKADQFVIGSLLGAEALGYYSAGFQLVIQPFSKINPILTHVSFPIFSSVKNDNQKLCNGYRKGIRILAAINSPILIGLAIISPNLIPFLMGPGWEKAIIITQILSIYVILRSLANVSVGLILAKEKYKWPFYWNLFLAFIIPITIFFTAKLTGSIIAVSLSLLGLQFFLFIMNYFIYIKKLLGNIWKALLVDITKPLFTTLIMGAGVILLDNFFKADSNTIKLAVSIISGIVLYTSLSFVVQRSVANEIIEIIKGK